MEEAGKRTIFAQKIVTGIVRDIAIGELYRSDKRIPLYYEIEAEIAAAPIKTLQCHKNGVK